MLCSCVYQCFRYHPSSDVTFHKFLEDKSRRSAWLRAIRREKFSTTNSSRVCSFHFYEFDLVLSVDSNPYRKRQEKGLKRKLLRKDVPSKFPKLPSNLTVDPVIPRSEDGTSTARLRKENEVIIEQTSALESDDSVSDIEDLERKYNSETTKFACDIQ